MLLYLNSPWDRAWGGELRVYEPSPAEEAEERHVDVVPEGGTLVLMRSDRVPHEVRTTHRPRQCIVGWFRSMRCRETWA